VRVTGDYGGRIILEGGVGAGASSSATSRHLGKSRCRLAGRRWPTANFQPRSALAHTIAPTEPSWPAGTVGCNRQPAAPLRNRFLFRVSPSPVGIRSHAGWSRHGGYFTGAPKNS